MTKLKPNNIFLFSKKVENLKINKLLDNILVLSNKIDTTKSYEKYFFNEINRIKKILDYNHIIQLKVAKKYNTIKK